MYANAKKVAHRSLQTIFYKLLNFLKPCSILNRISCLNEFTLEYNELKLCSRKSDFFLPTKIRQLLLTYCLSSKKRISKSILNKVHNNFAVFE